ncbi:natural killer cell receptor 2B4-like [Alligator mississippiensis]|uniref:Natural killer cell receptor 2B4-like n=1 Tax=Alligator mississippiensis TaxID=8496 RepID=A0A151MRI7_ALLMI|nr:natural killer cell receptor 2B4-like [Alligator mississippiensis]
MDLMLGDGSGITNNFQLFVIDHVQQPRIKASTSQECGRCYLTLSCLVPKAAWVTYSWSRGVSSHPTPEDHWLQEHQANVQLEITKSDSNTFYHCNVSNAISWAMATIDVKPLCNYTGCQEVKVEAAVGEMVQLQPKTWPLYWLAIHWEVELGSQTYWILRHEQNSTSANLLLPFADRVSFHPGNLSLQINSVTEKESGLYTMDLKLGDGSNITSYFRLFVLVPASSLSYCQAKGHILLLVLGALITGTVAVNIMAGKQEKWD